MSTYCGIDLHSNSSVISIIDETDRVIKEKRLDNNLAIIQEFLQPCQMILMASLLNPPTIGAGWFMVYGAGYPLHFVQFFSYPAIQRY
jgi:hypothetical protein